MADAGGGEGEVDGAGRGELFGDGLDHAVGGGVDVPERFEDFPDFLKCHPVGAKKSFTASYLILAPV